MDYEYRAAKTPLIDLLRKVPKDGRHMYDESPVMAHNIPYGRLCHEAADELEAWNRRASQAASDHIEDVRGMVPVYQIRPDCENWIDCTEKYYAEWKGDKRTLYNHAAPCARCAELEATNRQLNREVISVGDEAEDYAGKLAALEAENKQQAERIKQLEMAVAQNDQTARHYLEGRTEALQQLAALRELLSSTNMADRYLELKAENARLIAYADKRNTAALDAEKQLKQLALPHD